jgi:pyruvate dehydrogenase E1 component alpha subunit
MAVANEMQMRPASKAQQAVAASHGSSDNGRGDGAAERERLRMMMLIRKFEDRTVQEYSKGNKIGGFCHVYSGQEAIAVGIAAIFQKGKDFLINGYRCHGHSLALGMSPRACFAELLGKSTGCSKGKGGSMHFFDASVGNCGGHGIVGGHLPLGLGLAFAQAYKKTPGVTFCLFGDGAINQGTFNESLNMSSLLKAPVIWIVENNGVAMGTQVERSSAEKDLGERGAGFAMPHYNIDGNDVDVVIDELSKAADRARRGDGPSYIVANTYRFRGHSMSDPMKYRSEAEKEKAKLRDPIVLYAHHLHERGLIDDELYNDVREEQWESPMRADIAGEISAALRQADADPNPGLEDRFDDILAEKYPFERSGG